MKKGEPQPINVAIIGGGHTANLLGAMDRVKGFDVRSIGYATRSGKHRKAVGRGERTLDWGTEFSGEDLVANVKEMLSQDVRPDVVLVALPPYLTPGIVRTVLDNTPPETAVHVEKPVALYPAAVADLAVEIRDTGRVVSVGHQWIANPDTMEFFEAQVHDRVDRGEEVTRVTGRWHGDTFYKADAWWRLMSKSGGPLKEQGHPGHLLQHVLGERLGELIVSEEVRPQAYFGIPAEAPADVDMAKIESGLYVPTQIAAELAFADGTPVTLEASGIHVGPEVIDVVVAFESGTLVTFGKRDAKVIKNGEVVDARSTPYPWPAFEGQMENLLQAATGYPKGRLVTFDEAVKALTVADDVMQATRVSEVPLFQPELLRAA